jgi:hypothetical protein
MKVYYLCIKLKVMKKQEQKKGVRDVGLTPTESDKLMTIAIEKGLKKKTKKELIHMAIDIATGK